MTVKITNDTHTATVETVTAEVRVLMVGSRQITLSVAKQLDSYDLFADDEPLSFEPFGRIRTGAKGETLVRCTSGAHGAQWYPLLPPGGKVRCSRYPNCHHRMGHINGAIACGTTKRFEMREYDYQWVGRHTPTGNLIVVSAFNDDFYQYQYQYQEESAQFESWRELPLIVLAGLR